MRMAELGTVEEEIHECGKDESELYIPIDKTNKSTNCVDETITENGCDMNLITESETETEQVREESLSEAVTSLSENVPDVDGVEAESENSDMGEGGLWRWN